MSDSTFNNRPSSLRRHGVIAGVGVSLVLHALLIFGYRLSRPLPVEPPTQPARSMTVWLQPPKPPQPLVAKAEPPAPKPPAPLRKRVRPSEREPDSAPAPALAAQHQPAASQAITLPPPADPLHPEQQARQFDMNAALSTARKVANEKDPARANLPVAQLDNHPLYPEDNQSQLQKDMGKAKKSDCLQAGAGAGLLAPLVWLVDKHCKF